MFIGHNNREIVIKVTEETIYFYFSSELERHEKMMEEATEDYLDSMDEDDKEPSNFYWIPTKEWKDSFEAEYEPGKHHWQNHMFLKNWYTVEMNKFINKSLGLKKIIPNGIKMYLHCRLCMKEGIKANLAVGWTLKGMQIWCENHSINVAAFDFQGNKVIDDNNPSKSPISL